MFHTMQLIEELVELFQGPGGLLLCSFFGIGPYSIGFLCKGKLNRSFPLGEFNGYGFESYKLVAYLIYITLVRMGFFMINLNPKMVYL